MLNILMFIYFILFIACHVRGGWKDIPDILPTEEGSLHLVDLGLPVSGHVMAFGHFTNDRRLDCLVLNEGRDIISVYVLNPKDNRYSKSLLSASCPDGQEIYNVVVGDFNHDGYSDILLMHGPTGGSKNPSVKTELSLYLGGSDTMERSGWTITPSIGQVMPIDFSGTMQLSLFGTAYMGVMDKRPSIWGALASSPNELSNGFTEPKLISSMGKLSNPNWSTQADFNGDGLPDLLITTTEDKGLVPNGFEIWVRVNEDPSEELPYRLALRKSLPSGAGPLTVTDVDGDGNLDIIFSVCDPPQSCTTENSIHILYNSQSRFCSPHKNYNNCIDPDNLFPNDGRAFDFNVGNEPSQHMVISMKDLFPKEDLMVLTTDPISNLPISMSVGDYDLDSYPDLAIVVVPRNNPDDFYKSRAVILRNMPCKYTTCNTSQADALRRTFKVPSGSNFDALTSIHRVSGVAFADWYDIGPAGFLVNHYDGQKPVISTIKNGISRDAFFLRAEALSGVCPAPCSNKNTGSKSTKPVSSYIGATFRLSYVDPEGVVQVRTANQLGQTLNRALQSPTTLFGLGRTSNFVQKIGVGINYSASPRHYRNNIFMNSESIFSPPHADSSSTWRVELQINPSEYIMYVFISVASALLVLAIITAIFKYQEKREDDLERKSSTHLINFDAL